MNRFLLLIAGIFLLNVSLADAVCLIVDGDGDLVCDPVDNCTGFPNGNANGKNGPNQLSNQVDTDQDGYGNRCDTDFDNDLQTTAADLAQMLAAIGCGLGSGPCPNSCELDLDGDSMTTGDSDLDFQNTNPNPTVGDWAIFINEKFTQIGVPNRPGPSGLACAGTVPCSHHIPIATGGPGGLVTVGAPSNIADNTTGFGAVATSYRIGATEITNTQYVDFLNAVAADDLHDLYNADMSGPSGGITRTGASGSYSYTTVSGRQNMPVNYVSFYDAIRFANWLHNHQPDGAQDNTTTENGAYAITAQGIADNTITRKPGATVFLPSHDEWYKAAYYNSLTTSYSSVPFTFNGPFGCSNPGASPSTANCQSAVGDLTAVGSYTASPSLSGTFDQGGNVSEWNDSIISTTISDTERGLRGGSYLTSANDLLSNIAPFTLDPTSEQSDVGFRIATWNGCL